MEREDEELLSEECQSSSSPAQSQSYPQTTLPPVAVRVRDEVPVGPEQLLDGHAALLVGYLNGQCEDYKLRVEEAIRLGHEVRPEMSLFHSLQVPSLSIKDYVCRIARYASCSPECFVIALLFLHRYQYFTRMALSSRNVHRLTITAVLVATKSRDDIFFSNEYFGAIGGLQTKEMSALERRFLEDIQWGTYVDWKEFQNCLLELQKRMPQYFLSADELPEE